MFFGSNWEHDDYNEGFHAALEVKIDGKKEGFYCEKYNLVGEALDCYEKGFDDGWDYFQTSIEQGASSP